jgi:exonuclease SbcC
VLDRAEVGRLDAVIAAYDRELAVVAAGLGEPEIAGLDDALGTELVGGARDGAEVEAAVEQRVGLATERAAETEEAAGSIAAEAARARDRAERASTALVALRQAAAVGDDAAERARAIVRMADLASASSAVNAKGVTLGTYVLLRRFDDVVAAANVRLSVMSSGRYQLESSDEREATSRSRKTGLSLAIRDHATDTTRDPGSFSGGETFYASLSLALGLADVVQAEAGGLQLGTLFVDEGFGSLDPTTLDAVMTELGRLSAAGRVVGIVSHVDELKQRIADRIEVRRLPDGSSTLRSTAGG